MCKIEINGVSIILTQEQLELIDKQRSIITDYKQIKSIEDACKVLNINEIPIDSIKQIKTIVKAINKLIDNNTNFPDWSNENQYKYLPWFKYSKKMVGSFIPASTSTLLLLVVSVMLKQVKQLNI